MKTKLKLSSINPSLQLLLAVVLFSVSVSLARGDYLASWERSLFFWIYNWPEILTTFFLIITWFGAIYALAVLSLLLAVKKKFNQMLRLLLTAVLAYELTGFAKDLWGRGRPSELMTEVIARDYFRGSGFPSGHVALATTMAFVVGRYLPKKYQWIVPVWIIGVGLSRIYLGVHAPLDIVGGFAIGWFSYMLFMHVKISPARFGDKSKNSHSKL